MSEYHSTIYDDSFEPAAWELEPRFLNVARLYLGDDKRLGAFKWEYESRVGEIKYLIDPPPPEEGIDPYVESFWQQICALLSIAGCDMSAERGSALKALEPLYSALWRAAQSKLQELEHKATK